MRHEQDNDFDFDFGDEEVGGFRKIPRSPKVPRNQDSQKNKNKHMTEGQRIIGTFNPSKDHNVNRAKEICAELIDLAHAEFLANPTKVSQAQYDHTVGEVVNAQMNVVRVLTAKY